jgi:DNA-binding LacI/PurR family transcriptional regulator
MSKVTMDTIASELGISKNTVSRALRGLSGVSDSVRKKIIAQAENSGYIVKHKMAALLQIVMVHRKALMEDIFFWPSVLSGIMNFAADQGVSIRVVTVDSDNDGRNSLLSINNQKCDGLLVVNDIDDNTLLQMADLKLPMVVVDYYSDLVDCDFVLTANQNGIYKALTNLIENNHTKIGFLGNIDWRFSYRVRYEAFCYYMNKLGLPTTEKYHWLDAGYNDHSYFYKKVKQLMPDDNAPTAWICVNDVMAVDLAHVLKKEGYNVPDDVSIIGFDNSTYPGAQYLTTLEVQVKSLGQRAIEQLLLRIESPDKPHETLSINTSLIVRSSVRCL